MAEITKLPETAQTSPKHAHERPPIAAPRPAVSSRDHARQRQGHLTSLFVLATVTWVCAGIGLTFAVMGRVLGYPILGSPVQTVVTYSGHAGAAALVTAMSVLALVVKWLQPKYVLHAVISTSTLTFFGATIVTGKIPALLAALAILAFATALGYICMTLLALPAKGLSRLVIACGTGLGLFGILGFVMGSLGILNLAGIGGIALVILATVVAMRLRRRETPVWGLQLHAAEDLSWLESALVGAAAGLLVFSSLPALVPEVMFDPFRQHLPIAQAIWQSESVGVIPNLGVSRDPILGHVLFAIALGIGETNAAIVLNMVIGVGCIAAVACAAFQLAGRTAAVVSIIAYSAMPLALWEMGHAYTDLFPVFFCLVSLLCILLWQRDGANSWLLLAGLASASGFAAKLTAIWIIIPLVLGVILVGRRAWNLRERVIACLWFSAGAVAAVPWLARTLLIFGGLPAKLALFLESMFSAIPGVDVSIQQRVDPGFTPIVGEVGIGHEWLDFLRVPFVVAFASDKFPDQTIGSGDLGVVLPLLIPFVLLVPRTRSSLLIVMTVGISYFGWWFSPLQATRHLLPTLAFLSILVGAGVANIPALGSSTQKTLVVASRLAMTIGILLAPFLLVTGRMSQVPVDVVIGRVSAADYVSREVPAFEELAAANSLVEPNSPLLYIGKWGGAQLYTTARLVNSGQLTQEPLAKQFGSSDNDVLSKLHELGILAFIWDRPTTKPEDESARIVSLEFLSRHARLVQANTGYMLFELTPNAREFWNLDPDSTLVKDPEFRTIRRDNSEWASEGRLARAEGAVELRGGATASQTIQVSGDTPYLMVVEVACSAPRARTELSLQWLDAAGKEISKDSQTVYPGTVTNTQFLWARSPTDSVTAIVTLGGQSRCQVMRADVFEQPVTS